MEDGGRTRYMIWVGPNPGMIAILKAAGAYCDVASSKRWIFWRSSDEPTQRRTFQILCQHAKVDYENLEDE